MKFNIKYFIQSLFLVLFIGLFSPQGELGAQVELTPEQKTTYFKSLAKYTSGVHDKTSAMIERIGYQPPAYLQKEWKQFPAIRKIEMAYEAYENKSKGKGGKQFLALLSKNLSQKYQAIGYEKDLKPLEKVELGSKKLEYKHPRKYGLTKLPGEVRNRILTISKYTEAGALGGTRGVLKHKFGLPNETVYDILRSSKSSAEALEKGLERSKTPPTHSERINKVSSDLQRKYEGARSDPGLTQVEDNSSNKKTAPNRNRSVPASGGKNVKVLRGDDLKRTSTRIKKRYDSYHKANYINAEARKFKSMRVNRRGFGGVIFGSEVVDRTSLPGIKYIRVVPNDIASPDSLAMCDMEIVFDNGVERLIASILQEDVFVASLILFEGDAEYQDGEGIGLAGIDYENSIWLDKGYRRFETFIHPAISNLELGWSAIYADVFPIANRELSKNLSRIATEKQRTIAKDFFDGLPGNWKITDVPVDVVDDNGVFSLRRNDVPDSLLVPDAFITMYGNDSGYKPDGEENLFYRLVPVLTNATYEYYRLNEFSRVLSLLRWAKLKGGKLIEIPKNINFINTPESIYLVSDSTVRYIPLEEEKRILDKYITPEIDSLRLFLERDTTSRLIEVKKSITSDIAHYLNVRSNIWGLLLNAENLSNIDCDMSYKTESGTSLSILDDSVFSHFFKQSLSSISNELLYTSQYESWELIFENIKFGVSKDQAVMRAVLGRYCN